MTSQITKILVIGRHLVVHLLRAVEHIDHDTESSAQILGGLGLASTGWSSRCSTHGQMEGLGESDVAPVCVGGSDGVSIYVAISKKSRVCKCACVIQAIDSHNITCSSNYVLAFALK